MAIYAQANEPKTRTSKEAAQYFSKAELLDSTLILHGKEKFLHAEHNVQREMITYMFEFANARRVIVETDSISWLWFDYSGQLLSYRYNTIDNLLDKYDYAQVDRLGIEKWFATFGGELSFSTISSIGINGRVGTYLWRRFLDVGLGLNIGYYHSKGSNEWDVSANLSSRLYFTRFFTKFSLSPFVGVGMGIIMAPSLDYDPMAICGYNWYMRKGSIDVAIQYGRYSKFGISAGYTIPF